MSMDQIKHGPSSTAGPDIRYRKFQAPAKRDRAKVRRNHQPSPGAGALAVLAPRVLSHQRRAQSGAPSTRASRAEHNSMGVRNPAFVAMLIVIALLAVHSPLHGGSVVPQSPSLEVASEHFNGGVAIGLDLVSCQSVVNPGLPLPCPCDEVLALGCGLERLPRHVLSSIEPLFTANELFIMVGSIHTLCNPDLLSPPPQRIS